ncbi:MAG TPA: hypothetical protein DF383_06530 [Deltaproteobacteria bacterium]|nr:hypothetical protein [Deltaproteobacteria bacterium]
MRFWDASALLPLLVQEQTSSRMAELFTGGEEPASVWLFSMVEVTSALCRLFRMKEIHQQDLEKALETWKEISEEVTWIRDFEMVQERALRVLRLHPLKAADALQLASALVAVTDRTTSHQFVTLDKQLAEAANKEGFQVIY